jgi:hypothetical protein
VRWWLPWSCEEEATTQQLTAKAHSQSQPATLHHFQRRGIVELVSEGKKGREKAEIPCMKQTIIVEHK